MMHIDRIDLPTIPVCGSMFIGHGASIFTDTSVNHERGTVVYMITRNGTITVARYVPCDMYPEIKKPKKVQRGLEIHLVGDTVIRFNFSLVTDATELVELISDNLLSKEILTVRDADGFIKLASLHRFKGWTRIPHLISDYCATMCVSVVGSTNVIDPVTPAIANTFTTLSDEKVSISYNTSREDKIIVKREYMSETSRMLDAITVGCQSIGLTEKMIDTICGKAMYVVDVDGNYPEVW